MSQPNPTTTVTNPRVAKLIELEVAGRIKPEHQVELDTYRAQGKAPKKSSGNNLTEYQGKSTGFYERAVGADRDFGAAGAGGEPVGYGGDIARSILPENVVNSWTSPERQKAQQAKEDFIRASLRYESGAAIGGDEFKAQDKIFFPQTGDSDETIKQKAAARNRVIESLKVAAGPGAANGANTVIVPEEVANKLEAGSLSKEQQAAYDAFNIANPKATAEQLNAFATSIGAPLANADEIIKDRDAGRGLAPGSSARYQAPDISDARGKGGGVEGTDAFVRGMADTASLGFADEISAAGDTITGTGTMDENLRRQREIDRYDAENSPWLRGGGQVAGGLLLPIGRGATSIRDLAGVGGVSGAGYGIGSGENLTDRAIGGVSGGVAGAALGAGFGKLGQIWKNRRPPTGGGGGAADTARDVAEASADLGIDMLPADAGGPFVRAMTTVARSTPGGIVPVTRAAQKSQRQAGGALSAIASREGTVLDAENMGNAVRDGALKFRSGSRNSVGRIYDRAAQEAGDARVTPSSALDTLDRNIAELSEVPGGADGLSVLQGLRDELADRGTITVNGIRGMRTQLRQKFAKDNLRGSDVERRVNDVIDAASEDLASSLEAQGKGKAAASYREADRQWADRIKTLDDVIMPIIGKKGEKSGEQIATALNSAAKGNNARMAKLFEALPEEEAGTARATMIESLGKASAGTQNAAGSEFSFNTFLTNWNKLGASAKNSMFRGENREAIDKLALIADRSKAASKYQNYSGTAAPVVGAMTAVTGAASIITLGKVLAAQYAAGALLSSPRVAKAILNIAQAKTPEAVATRISNLSNLATREPALSAEIAQLQQRLLQAVNDNAPRAAAASEGQKENR